MNYLDWAKKALMHVKKLNIQSNNIGTGELSPGMLDDMGRFLNGQFGIIHSELISKYGDTNGQSNIMAPAIVGRKFSWGNCEAKAALAFIFLGENGVTPIEVMSVGDDHILLVLGRNQKGKIPDLSTWGETAVVCDPWADDAYGAQLLRTKATQPPLADVVGATLRISQTFEHVGTKWPPEEIRKSLEAYKYLLPK
jgi:hypothetical protein